MVVEQRVNPLAIYDSGTTPLLPLLADLWIAAVEDLFIEMPAVGVGCHTTPRRQR